MARSSQAELAHNTALIADPAQFARDHGAASRLLLEALQPSGRGGR
jgi:hypothetical protein